MHQSAAVTWFFTAAGERLGPVTFVELQGKAKGGDLNPRHDLVWTQGMAEWQPAGEVSGLFDRALPVKPRESLAAPAAPYEPHHPESTASLTAMRGEWPGVRRRSYLFNTLLLPFLVLFGTRPATPLLTAQFGTEIAGLVVQTLLILPIVVGIYTGIQRLVNLGMSRWWYLANFIPVVNLWLWYRSFAAPSGYAYHKKLDGIGILLAIIYWAVVIFTLLAFGYAIAILFGELGTPENRKQLQETLRTAKFLKS